MERKDAREEWYELMEIDGTTVIFTNMRIDRSTIPDGLYLYEVRDSDDLDGSFAEIKWSVCVNHWGSIITKEEFPLTDFGSYFPEDCNYLGQGISLEEYIDMDTQQIK